MTNKTTEELRREFVDSLAKRYTNNTDYDGTFEAARALLAALDREKAASTEPHYECPYPEVCPTCAPKPEPPKRKAEDALADAIKQIEADHPRWGIEWHIGTLKDALALVRELRAERDKLARRIEKAKSVLYESESLDYMHRINVARRILSGTDDAKRGEA